jgi:hypothetical protein
VAAEQPGLVGGGEIAIVGNALVKIVGNEIEYVFLKIRTGTADAVNLVLLMAPPMVTNIFPPEASRAL